MANKSVQEFTGSMIVDVTALAGVLLDAAPGATRNLKREGTGIGAVLAELGASMPAHGSTVGVAQEVHARIVTTTARIAQVRQAKQNARKLAEVLGETEALLEDDREADIGIVVSAVRRAATRKDSSLLAPFEQTLRYLGQTQVRAAKTRRKNAAARKEAAQLAAAQQEAAQQEAAKQEAAPR